MSVDVSVFTMLEPSRARLGERSSCAGFRHTQITIDIRHELIGKSFLL